MATHKFRLLTLLMAAQTCFAQGQWTHIGDMPEIRYAHTVNELNGKIYVVGGIHTETSVYPRTALVYDTSSGIWTHIPLCNNTSEQRRQPLFGRLYVGGNDNTDTTDDGCV
jgi:hypothetical protein